MNWWKSTVVYQIYPKSFYDANGDGIGDLKGISQKIPYLAKLGIGAIWISPFFSSPMVDNGYDVADYCAINSIYGTMTDFEELVQVCQQHEIKIIVDFVANHTSTAHQWFQKALAGKPKYKNYYYISKEPVWAKKSVFGGEAWKKINSEEYYLHSFAVEQADLNWTNQAVRQEFKAIMNFWIAKGIGGVRFDVIDDIGKTLDPLKIANGINVDLERLHQYVKEWRAESDWAKHDLLTVGECWDASVEKAILYSDPQREEMAMVFGFEHIQTNWTTSKWNLTAFDLVKFKAVIAKWQNGLYNKGWQGLFLNNHDLPRMLSHFGDAKFALASAKTLALTLHILQGTPFIYQGEEIGMTNCVFDDLDEHNDIEIHQTYQALVAQDPTYTKVQHLKFVAQMNRDNARTPMQWSAAKHAGFTSGKPWLKVNPNFDKINVAQALADSNSLFYWYQKLISLRKADANDRIKTILIHGKFNLLEAQHEQLFAYERVYQNQKLIVLANWSSQTLSYPFVQDQVILNTHSDLLVNQLMPWQAVLIFTKI